MEIIKENLGVSLPNEIITEHHHFLSKICQNKLDLKSILSMMHSYQLGTDEYNLLFLIQSLIVLDITKNVDENKYLLENIGYLALRFMNVNKETTPFIKGDSLKDIDFVSEEFKTHCEAVSQSFWGNNHMNETIRFFYLSLISHFMSGRNLFDAQPYLLIDGAVSAYRYVCGINEMVHMFFMLLGEYYQHEKIVHDDFRYPENIDWVFDNPNNPMEAPIKNYAMEHGLEMVESDSGPCVQMSYDVYHQLVKKVYQTDAVIHAIQSELSQNKILEKYYQTLDDPLSYKKFIILIYIYEFMMSGISELLANTK